MARKYVFTNLFLWLISIIATIIITAGTETSSYLAPLMVVCMIGSTIIVRRAAGK
jgi:hypothetical protein